MIIFNNFILIKLGLLTICPEMWVDFGKKSKFLAFQTVIINI